MGVKGLAGVEGGMGHVSMGRGTKHAGMGGGKGSGMGLGKKGAPPAGGAVWERPGTGDSHALRLGGIAQPRPCNTP